MASASRLILATLLSVGSALCAAADPDGTVRQVQFAKGTSTAVLKGSVEGRKYIDFLLRAGAGQKLRVSMHTDSRSNYFNILPPVSQGAAMFIEGAGDRKFEGLLPDDGVYAVRVYLVRAAARRNEKGEFTLSLGVEGKPLAPLPAKVDALIPGTRFHASSRVRCEPPFTKTRECDAFVIRRGQDGTATVELHWDKSGKRRILFIKGRPEAADVPQPFTFTRDEKGYVVVFGGEERFEVPEPLLSGG